MLLEVSDLSISYGDIRAVSGVSFALEKGELVSIIGANGAGKTSILGGIMGMVPVRQGSIRFKGREMNRLASFARARAGMRLVPERARVFPRLSVLENLMTGVYGLRKKIDVGRRIAWLHDLFPILKERGGQPASTLSGGEQQQLAIARALISNPELLLVDEVSMGLMPIARGPGLRDARPAQPRARPDHPPRGAERHGLPRDLAPGLCARDRDMRV